MALTFTKAQRAKVIEVMEQDFETADDAAVAVLAKAMELVAERAKFTVVGQVRYPDNTRGDKIALGYYATAKQANDDGLKLAYSTATHEEHLAWVLPVHHGTPASYYDTRRKANKLADITDHSIREREVQRRAQWFIDNPGQTPPKDWGFVPFDNEMEDCWFCDGLGKVKKEAAA